MDRNAVVSESRGAAARSGCAMVRSTGHAQFGRSSREANVHPPDGFDSHFEPLTGHAPFPWQQALFGEFLQMRFPKTCDIPTGLGKTSIIAIWLLALAHHARTG